MRNSIKKQVQEICEKERVIEEEILSTIKCPDCGEYALHISLLTTAPHILCFTCRYTFSLGSTGENSPLFKKFIEDPTQFKTSSTEMINRVNSFNQQVIERSKPHCPRCGSTSITAGQRGYSLLTGFLGSGSTVNRCANCGHKWKPRR